MIKSQDQKFILPKQAKDLSQQRFGRLLALEPIGKNKFGRVVWKCRCDCGQECVVRSSSLLCGETRSCGCFQKENAAAMKKTHGMHGSLIYKVWNAMIQRCENPKCKSFEDYGGRGIKVCEEWHKFENFYKDMGDKPEGKSLDRSDNDGNYESGNCRWATGHEQQMNRRLISKGPTKQREFFAFSFKNMRVYSSNNQNQFARDHGLCASAISSCLHHRLKAHHKWTFAFAPND